MSIDRGIYSEDEYEYQRTKMEYLHSSDQADPLMDSLKRTNVMQGSG